MAFVDWSTFATFVSRYMKMNRIRIFTMMLGCLLAAVLVCSQFLSVANKQQEQKSQVTTGQTENSGEEEFLISLPSFSLPTPVHVKVNLDFRCLFEILYEDQEECVPSGEEENFTEKFLSTLFRAIISPNAP